MAETEAGKATPVAKDRRWEELNEAERAAAELLGHTPESWNQMAPRASDEAAQSAVDESAEKKVDEGPAPGGVAVALREERWTVFACQFEEFEGAGNSLPAAACLP